MLKYHPCTYDDDNDDNVDVDSSNNTNINNINNTIIIIIKMIMIMVRLTITQVIAIFSKLNSVLITVQQEQFQVHIGEKLEFISGMQKPLIVTI